MKSALLLLRQAGRARCMRIIAGPDGVRICDECVRAVHVSILDDGYAARHEPRPCGRLDQAAHAPGDQGRAWISMSSGRTRPRWPCPWRYTTTISAFSLAAGERRGAAEEQHPADRPHRLRQDAVRPDPGPYAEGALRHRRRHHPDRGGLCGRRRGEHPAAASPGGGLRCGAWRSGASSMWTRWTRSPARARTPPSPATCPARACSRRC